MEEKKKKEYEAEKLLIIQEFTERVDTWRANLEEEIN